MKRWKSCAENSAYPKDKPKNASALFSKYKLELVAANKVACNETMAWLLN